MFNDDYSIIFSHQELVERNECNAKSHITTNTNSETAKSHFTCDFNFRCRDGVPANLNLYAKDRENENTTMENVFSMITVSYAGYLAYLFLNDERKVQNEGLLLLRS